MLVLRDLEGRPDDEIARALGAQEQAVPGLVGTARLRLHGELRLPQIGAPCPGRLPALSAYADDTLAAEERDELAGHVTGCANCRAALFALREAALRYATLPVPEPPGDIGSRIAHCARRGWPAGARSRGSEPVAGGGRQTAVAVAMGALALVGVGVTIAAAGDDGGAAKPPRLRCRPSPRHSRARRCPTRPWRIGAVSVPVTRPRRPPPVLHHQRAGTHRRAHAHAPAQRAPGLPSRSNSGWASRSRPKGRRSWPRRRRRLAVTTPKPKPTPVHDIPVDVLPPNPPPTAAQAASQTSPDPPPPPEAPPPEQTTST